jgi:TDG/mug DNA glycosylase family protein
MRSSAAEAAPRLVGLPPIVNERSRVLILGSFPSEASLLAQQYYAYPRNQFWPIMQELFDVDRFAAYEDRVSGLLANGIAVWDVIHECTRVGSADSTIKEDQPNSLLELLRTHSLIGHVAFNGSKSEETAIKNVSEIFESGVVCQRFPSTSPANATLSLAAKVAAWARLKEWLSSNA